MGLDIDRDNPGMKAFITENQQGISCDEVIKCVLDITGEGWNIFHFIHQNGPVRVDRIAEFLGKDRSTAYRELQKLCNCGICHKEPANLKEGGYYFLYHARPMEDIKKITERCIDATYKSLKEAINENFTPHPEE
jgi:predicted transcriptional regulator